MGQQASAATTAEAAKSNLHTFSRDELSERFYQKTVATLTSSYDVARLTARISALGLQDQQIITFNGLYGLFRLPAPNSGGGASGASPSAGASSSSASGTTTTTTNAKYEAAASLLFESFKVIGHFPFLQDYEGSGDRAAAATTTHALMVAALFHTQQHGKVVPEYNYLKLLFISLSLAAMALEVADLEKTAPADPTDAPAAAATVACETDARGAINWATVKPVQSFDEIDIAALTLKKKDLVSVLTLLLIVESAASRAELSLSPPAREREIREIIAAQAAVAVGVAAADETGTSESPAAVPSSSEAPPPPPSPYAVALEECVSGARWAEFEKYATALASYIELGADAVTFNAFRNGVQSGFPGFFQRALPVLFRQLLGTKPVPKARRRSAAQENENIAALVLAGATGSGAGSAGAAAAAGTIGRRHKTFKFMPSKLLTHATVAFLSSVLEKTAFQVTPQNLVNLYSGAEAGFSIRSLESKIFKWQAPTIFLVSGKRLKNKTITTNKRYEHFSEEYPRFFRTAQEAKRTWQRDNDKITYAVCVHQPWRVSNKKNFGDAKSVIVAVEPHFDIYRSTPNAVLKGESAYFNTLGMGIGFGNDQPVHKNGVKKYFPGETSLTVEPNLEFAVFRHIVSPTSNAVRYFNKSEQAQLAQEDFEDRFMITDLEVWGLGSTKELDEQKKQWEWEAQQAEARQSVNLKSLGEERAFLEMAGIIGNHGSGGSV